MKIGENRHKDGLEIYKSRLEIWTSRPVDGLDHDEKLLSSIIVTLESIKVIVCIMWEV